MALTLKSDGFTHEASIPSKYTCDGGDISPQLQWDGVPDGTQSFVLICDDPDAPMGTWDHWLLFNIPADLSQLQEGLGSVPSPTQEGKNSWGRQGYGGPCPPSGVHRYFFKLYAMDTVLELKSGATKAEIENAMKGHVLEQTELMGRYERNK